MSDPLLPESAFRTLMLDLALLGHINDRDMLIKSIGRMIRELARAREQLAMQDGDWR